MIDIDDLSYSHNNIARYTKCADVNYDIYNSNIIYVFYYILGLYTLLIFFITNILTRLEKHNKLLEEKTKYTLLLINSKFDICDDSYIHELDFSRIQKDIKKIGMNTYYISDSDSNNSDTLSEDDGLNSQSDRESTTSNTSNTSKNLESESESE